jgi:purine-binding chemotaxis protein CheW
MSQDATQAGTISDVAGKYLAFRLAGEDYGIEILKVVEIIKMMEVTRVPQTPEHVRGVVNLRGKVIPVVDLRLKFGMEQAADTSDTCIIVVNVGQIQTGIVIDEVSEVLDIVADDIEPAPQLGSDVDTRFIIGMAKAGDSVKILIDTDRVLNAEELEDHLKT